MEFLNYYVGCFKNYANFNGRARRKEYWSFSLISWVVSLLISWIAGALHLGFISVIYALAIIVPTIAVNVRRLHDIGKGGVWYLINFIPCIGQIWYLVLMFQDSMPGTNEYGVNPKEVVDSNYM